MLGSFDTFWSWSIGLGVKNGGYGSWRFVEFYGFHKMDLGSFDDEHTEKQKVNRSERTLYPGDGRMETTP